MSTENDNTRREALWAHLRFAVVGPLLAAPPNRGQLRAELERLSEKTGLEFDSVFLVNMHQRRREDTSLPRIRELRDGGIEVTALGAAEGEADELAKEPNRVEEEEKRLLYVALTRARRRLGLSAVTADGFEPERSLLGLLPQSFQGRFRETLDAGSEVSEVEWRGHPLRILRPAEGRKFHRRDPERRDRLRLEPLSPDACEAIEEAQGEQGASRDDIPAPPELLGSGEVHRMVPFALARGAAVVRGVIDLLVVEADKATAIERLPGPPSAEQRSRMEICLEAVETLAPGRVVTGFFVVTGAPPVLVNRLAPGQPLHRVE